MSGPTRQAIARMQEALGHHRDLGPSHGLRALKGTLHSELGEVLMGDGGSQVQGEAGICAALTIAEDAGPAGSGSE